MRAAGADTEGLDAALAGHDEVRGGRVEGVGGRARTWVGVEVSIHACTCAPQCVKGWQQRSPVHAPERLLVPSPLSHAPRSALLSPKASSALAAVVLLARLSPSIA